MDAISALLARDPASHVNLSDAMGIGELLRALREVGAADTVTALAARAADQAELSDAVNIAQLLRALGEAGAANAVTTLASRTARHADLNKHRTVEVLLRALREAETAEEFTMLATRAADSGFFKDFLNANPDHAREYAFGREIGGSPSAPWEWDNGIVIRSDS